MIFFDIREILTRGNKLASQNLLPLRDGVSGLERIIQQQKLFDQVYRYLFAFFSTLTSI